MPTREDGIELNPGQSERLNTIRGRFTKSGVMAPCGVFLFALTLYLWSVCPTIGFGDTALMIDAMASWKLDSQVNTHPFTVLLGALLMQLPLGELAFKANVVSVLVSALAVTLIFVAVRCGGGSIRAAVVAAACGAFMHSMWWHATIVENYASSALFIGLCYAALLKLHLTRDSRYLYCASFIAGLSIFNHVQNSFLCLGVAVIGCTIAYRERALLRILSGCFNAALLGLLPWTALVAYDAVRSGNLFETIKNAFVGAFEGTFFSAGLLDGLLETTFITWNQSPLLLLPLCALLGVFSFVRRHGWYPSVPGFLLHILMTIVVFSGYPTWDRFAFLLAAFYPLAILSGFGFDYLISPSHPYLRRFAYVWALCTVVSATTMYTHLPTLAGAIGGRWFSRFDNGHSWHLYNQGEYVANPNKREYRDVEQFSERLFEALPQGAVFLDDDSRTYYPLALYYQRYLRKRPDVAFMIVNSWGIAGWGLSADSLTSRIERAYYLGVPFFVASLGPPYDTFFHTVQKRIPLEFEKFPLSSTQWVYRLVPFKEEADKVSQLRALGAFRSIEISGASGVVNVSVDNVVFSTADALVQQPMAGFGAAWRLDDQLFVRGGGTGTRVDLVLTSPKSRQIAPQVELSTAPDFGVVQISVGEREVARVDLYSPGVGRTSVTLPATTLDSSGAILSLRIVGKSERSSGYNLGIDAIRF